MCRDNHPDPIDSAALIDRCMNDINLVTMLLDRFERQLVDDMASIDRAIAAQDTSLLAHTAHALKGASAALTAYALRDLAARIEGAARQHAIGEAAACAEQLRHEADRCMAYLPAFRRSALTQSENGAEG
jgi:two-component system sensor histidine kinase/response regulator